MIKIVAALVASLVAPGVATGFWVVCVSDAEGLLTVPLRGAVTREFNALMGPAGVITFGGCPERDVQIALSIEREPPANLDGVLGLAFRSGGRIEPNLKVFLGPLERLVGESTCTEGMGRAIARVAGHETRHFLDQRSHHCKHGILQAMFSAHQLSAAVPRGFREEGDCGPGAARLRSPKLGPSADR